MLGFDDIWIYIFRFQRTIVVGIISMNNKYEYEIRYVAANTAISSNAFTQCLCYFTICIFRPSPYLQITIYQYTCSHRKAFEISNSVLQNHINWNHRATKLKYGYNINEHVNYTWAKCQHPRWLPTLTFHPFGFWGTVFLASF